MSRILVADYYVPRQQLDRERVRVALRALLARNFTLVPVDGVSLRYWGTADNDWHEWTDAATLDDALLRFDDLDSWGITLVGRADVDEPDYVDFSVATEGKGDDPYWTVGLSIPVHSYEVESTLSRKFLGWSVFLANLVGAHYGWGGSDLGLFNWETAPVAQASLTALEPQPLEWLNVFGPAYVARLGGRERLLATPAWRVELVADGAVAVTLAEHPYLVSQEDAARVAAHLGVPLPARPG